jgi:hypothetical protein
MTVTIFKGFPRQQLSYKQKTTKWGKKCVDVADTGCTVMNNTSVRKSVRHKRINRDLVNMKLHYEDIVNVLNPNNLKASFVPKSMQHYPTINSYLELLRGECLSRPFEWNVVVTNPNALSDIEEKKKDKILETLKSLIQDQSLSEDDFNKKLQEQSTYFQLKYKDMREVRANRLLNHYLIQDDYKSLFDSDGFMDALIYNEEHYYIDIVGGEPHIEKIDPEELHIYKSGSSNRTEDADLIVWETYRSIGWVYDNYNDVLTKKDRDYLEKIVSGNADGNYDSKDSFLDSSAYSLSGRSVDEAVSDPRFFSTLLNDYGYLESGLPYNGQGDVRVLKVFWKSRRKIKKVKKYDFKTGEEEIHFYPETYVINKSLGEEEDILWVNEAWEGTKIGSEIYVNIRPKPVQYNSMSNPSRCHFGIVGQLYNIGKTTSPSIVDILKPYAYNYDITMDKLYKLIDSNLGKLTIFDTASIPDSWKVEEWLYFAKKNRIAVKNSFNEGKKGSATGKLYGAMNTNTSGVIDASLSNEISFNIELLNWINTQMGQACGITPQRLGQISNRETVGGVERSTLQSSHVTEYLFARHDNLKKRVLEAFLETAKIALKGRKKKFEYLLSNGCRILTTIDGDEFAECDYGLAVDNSQVSKLLMERMDTLAQAGLQNQMFNFSTMLKLYATNSISEKISIMEDAEQKAQEMQEQQRQYEMQLQQQQQQAAMEEKQADRDFEERQNDKNNETKIITAMIQASANENEDTGANEYDPNALTEKERLELSNKSREIDNKYDIDKEKLNIEREKLKNQQ